MIAAGLGRTCSGKFLAMSVHSIVDVGRERIMPTESRVKPRERAIVLVPDEPEAEGTARGRLQGMVTIILRLLAHRLGNIPKSNRCQVLQTGQDELGK